MTINNLKRELPADVVEKLGPQDKLVYEYLSTGRTLTNQVAIGNLGVGSLSRRITTLRRAGLDVVTSWGKDHFERRYKKYRINPEKADA